MLVWSGNRWASAWQFLSAHWVHSVALRLLGNELTLFIDVILLPKMRRKGTGLSRRSPQPLDHTLDPGPSLPVSG